MLFAGCKCRALIGRKKNALPSKLIFYKAVPDPNLEIRGGGGAPVIQTLR